MKVVNELDNPNGDDIYKNELGDVDGEVIQNMLYLKQQLVAVDCRKRKMENSSDDQGVKIQRTLSIDNELSFDILHSEDQYNNNKNLVVVNCCNRKLDNLKDDEERKIQRILSDDDVPSFISQKLEIQNETSELSSKILPSKNLDDNNEETKLPPSPNEAINPKVDDEKMENDGEKKMRIEETVKTNEDDEKKQTNKNGTHTELSDIPVASIIEIGIDNTEEQFKIPEENDNLKVAISNLKKRKFPTWIRIKRKSIYDKKTKKFGKKTVIWFNSIPDSEYDYSCYVTDKPDQNSTVLQESITDEFEPYLLPLRLSEETPLFEITLPSIDSRKFSQDYDSLIIANKYVYKKAREMKNLKNKTPTLKSCYWIFKILKYITEELDLAVKKMKKLKRHKSCKKSKSCSSIVGKCSKNVNEKKKQRDTSNSSKENLVDGLPIVQEKKSSRTKTGNTTDTCLLPLEQNLSDKTFLAESNGISKPNNIDKIDEFEFAMPITVAEFNARRKSGNKRKANDKTGVESKQSMLDYWSNKICTFVNNEITKSYKDQKHLIYISVVKNSQKVQYYELKACADTDR